MANNIIWLFKKQVRKSPNKKAIICQNWWVTYKELDEMSNDVAGYIKKQGYKKDSIVAIMIPRSIEMIIYILGVLKSGLAYLPIDPAYPADRVDYMLDNSKAVMIVSNQELCKNIMYSCKFVDYEQYHFRNSDEEIQVDIDGNDLAYVIYTSGSTGKPKGVMIEHKAVTNFIYGMNEVISFKDNSTILNLTTVSFDIFFVETLLPLTNGLQVVIADEREQINPHALKKLIKIHNVNMMQVTPSRLKLLFTEEDEIFNQIDTLMVGGEPFPELLLPRLSKYSRMKVYNMYGPTETTIWSTIKDLTGQEKVTIGYPILNTQIYILDEEGKLVKEGNVGELCIGGLGVARGYIGRDELTREKFVTNSPWIDERYYKTGDLVRCLETGELECLGRVDNQVKIRGYRVELEEIENCLLSSGLIKNCAVGVKESKDGTKYLCALVIYRFQEDEQALMDYAKLNLTEYMIPTEIITVSSLPMTQNEKLDRNELEKKFFSISKPSRI